MVWILLGIWLVFMQNSLGKEGLEKGAIWDLQEIKNLLKRDVSLWE